MPQISRFFGIIIYMYFNDHSPPHFHAEYGEYEAVYAIETLETLRGSLPRRAHGMVVEWATFHRDELRKNWELARQMQTLNGIEPLE
ncbi:MAG: transcriptional regulator [Anaerolineaceae bacterium]|nr:transcriptional regulator [Anaerolineaceae bacterium]